MTTTGGGGSVTSVVEKVPRTARMNIIHAAASEFAVKPYNAVSLDDILTHAEVGKGALYTHFRSKMSLARAIVRHRARIALASYDELRAPSSPAIENLIDISYLVATADIGEELARAALNLLESVGRFDGLQGKIVGAWIDKVAVLVRRAIDEGDMLPTCDPTAVGRLIVGMYLGIRQTGDLDDPKSMIRDLETAWLHVLPGCVAPDRHAFLRSFIQRRSALAVRNTAPLVAGAL